MKEHGGTLVTGMSAHDATHPDTSCNMTQAVTAGNSGEAMHSIQEGAQKPEMMFVHMHAL